MPSAGDANQFTKGGIYYILSGAAEYTPTASLQRGKTPPTRPLAQSSGAVEYTDCISAEE